MCGKFTQMASWREVHAFSRPLVTRVGGDTVQTATPMRIAHILRLDAAGKRVMVPMRWGFSRRARAAQARPDHMHARAETADQLPTFRDAFARNRGILLVHTFNEGEELPNGRTRQWVITPKDGEPVAIAVICEPGRQTEAPDWTFVQVTTPANGLIAPLTDRMPAVLPRTAWPVWLGETSASPAEAKALLMTFDDAGSWDIAPQDPRPGPKGPPQPDLFG